MATVEGLPLLQPLCALPLRRLRLGPMEAAVVQALLAQREQFCQTKGASPLCLSLTALAQRVGLPPANLRRMISRLNGKLAAQQLVIACLHANTAVGQMGYALFRLPEIAWMS